MLNEIINIDLHIHSFASSYKEEKDYVKDSNIENIDVLLKKLNEKNINLFAITDHNNFDIELYNKIKMEISLNKYKNIKNVLPGVEFDVKIENNLEACHIICIFDDSSLESLTSIGEALNIRKLNKPNDFYTLDEFEKILKKIDLNTILIAHQHKHFDNKSGGKRSLSNSVSDIYEFIETGYINALEYQRPNVQGMIINSLKKVKRNVATIIGSDCHQWNCYPKKDNKVPEKEYITKIKALPTFDGLMFAFTSTSSRFNRINDNSENYVEKIIINKKEILLSKGINAIIGDNGSGKSMLLDIINDEKLKKEYLNIKKINDISVIKRGIIKKEYIKQNQIIDDVRDGKLFDNANETYYKNITSDQTFKNRITNYSKKLILSINKKIDLKEKIEQLDNMSIELITEEYRNMIPTIKNDIDTLENESESRLENLQNIYDSLSDEYSDNKKFYKKYNELNIILKSLKSLINKLVVESEKINVNNVIIGSIINNLEILGENISKNETDKEKEYKQYKSNKQAFIKSITDVINLETKGVKIPDFPKPIKGSSKKNYKGYNFYKNKKYNSIDLTEDFINELFVKDYNTLEKIGNIKTKEQLITALNGISKYEDIENWYKKVDSFINEYSKEETYIEKISSKQAMGSTPGEVSLVFYDFKLKNDPDDKNVICIDQPEDDISNNNISKELINYIETNRDKKQIIIVTHNPVLVVNLDVDNVVLLNKNYKNEIIVKNGCLEYSNDKYSIIKEIAENMDGGKDIVEKRFRLYENKC